MRHMLSYCVLLTRGQMLGCRIARRPRAAEADFQTRSPSSGSVLWGRELILD